MNADPAVFVAIVDPAVDRHQGGSKHDATALLEQFWPDDDIGWPGLVLDGDEHHALGGTGLLAHEDDAGDFDAATIAHVP